VRKGGKKLTQSQNLSQLDYRELGEFFVWTNEKFRLHKLAQKQTVKNMLIKRGQIYWAALGKNVGSEQNEKRPVIILQNDQGNRFAPTTIVAPITDPDKKRAKPLPVEVPIDLKGPNPNDPSNPITLVKGVIRLQQIRVLSKARLEKMICDLNDPNLTQLNPNIDDLKQRIDRACKKSLGL
jgi:mRNA interferase MazF